MFAVLLWILPGCPSPSQEPPTLAVVNGRPITQAEFDLRWTELPDARRAHYSQEGGKRQFLDDLITHELLVQEARRLGLDRSPALHEHLEQLKEQIILEDLTQHVLAPVEVTDAELDAHIAGHRDELPGEAEIRIAHIVVDNLALARQLKRQLDRGGNFAKIAARFSVDKASRGHGGELGVFRPGSASPEVDTAILSMKAGMITEPIKTEAGYQLIKIISREVPDPQLVHAMREQLRRELGAEKRLKQYADFIARLRANAVIRREG